jgi:hypothetical protein
MKRFLLFVVSVFLNIAMLSAQNSSSVISGEVKDSKGTLAGASVFLIKDMSTQDIYQHTITDDNGRFSITVPVGDYVLGVSYVGYAMYGQKINVTEGNNNVGSIVLEETTQELQNVVVQGKIVHVRTQPDGFSVDVKDIRERANDALDLLKLIPRVKVKGEELSVIGKKKVLVKIGNVLQRVDASELTSVLKGYTAGLIDKVEVVTQPPLRYDPDGDAAMIILHTSSVFKEYIGGTIGTEEMIGGKDNFRYGGYGSLLYNHSGLFVSIAPSINFNGSKSLEQQEYETNTRLYKVSTPSLGRYNYKGIRGNLQYEYNNNGFIGLAFSWNKKKYDNLFESSEETSSVGIANRIVNNKNAYNSGEPRFTATTYWETILGNKENKMWLELSYFNLTNNSQTDYAGHENSSHSPFLKYTENNDLKTSGLNFNNDYAIYLDAERKFLLETGVKGSWSSTTNYRAHNESVSPVVAIHQKNNIRWNELTVVPYASGTLHFNKQWWIRAGLKYVGTKSNLKQIDGTTNFQDVSKYTNTWLPTFHASYTPSSRHQITLTLNSSIEQPKFKDLNPFEWQINEFSFYRGNTKLRPQRYYITNLGYTFMNALYVKGCVKRGLGIISGVSSMQGNKVYTQVENTQNCLFVGLEAGYYFDKWAWLSASIDSYFGRNKYTSNNSLLLSESKGNEWGVNTYLDFTFNKSRTWTGFISGEYTGRKQTTAATIEPLYDLGIGMSYFLLNRRLSLTVSGLNLLSSRYKGVSYRQGYTISFNNRYDYPTLYFSISYKFSNGKDKSSLRISESTGDIENRF